MKNKKCSMHNAQWLFALLMMELAANAQLTATVTPGYQFGSGEMPTAGTLNLLGQPTIAIAGTVSGSVGLAAKSVTGVYLADSVVDGVTLDYTAASPRNIEIKAAGVGVAHISTSIAGAALSGGGGAALMVNVDSNTIVIVAGNKLALGSVVGATNINYGPVTLTGASPAMNWQAGLTYTWTLGAGPNSMTFANLINGASMILRVLQDGTGGRTVGTWPAGIKWRGGAAPTLSTGAGVADIIQFIDVGGTVYGTYGLNFQ